MEDTSGRQPMWRGTEFRWNQAPLPINNYFEYFREIVGPGPPRQRVDIGHVIAKEYSSTVIRYTSPKLTFSRWRRRCYSRKKRDLGRWLALFTLTVILCLERSRWRRLFFGLKLSTLSSRATLRWRMRTTRLLLDNVGQKPKWHKRNH